MRPAYWCPDDPLQYPGWAACGCIMDVISHCYRSRMRLYRDRPDVLTWGRWHWCPAGAIVVPFTHPFCSRYWDPDGWENDGLLGEVTEPHEYYKGNSHPRLLGRRVCGSQDVWENGSLFSMQGTPIVDTDPDMIGTYADGIPRCCRRKRAAFDLGFSAAFDSLNAH